MKIYQSICEVLRGATPPLPPASFAPVVQRLGENLYNNDFKTTFKVDLIITNYTKRVQLGKTVKMM